MKTDAVKASEFESLIFRHYAQIAQSVEQGTENPRVSGSIPLLGTTKKYKIKYGRIAQLGEHLPYKQGVTGSSPVATTIKYGGVAQFG